jgi:uncharacterized damage-inducible protein DinB
MSDPRYPIGKHQPPATFDAEVRRSLIAQIEEAPARLREAVAGLTDAQLDTRYRDGGWTVRQVAHHLPDSHLNAYVRFKLAVTEAEPTIKTYEEARWAELADAATAPVEPSLDLLAALHRRWVLFLRSLTEEQFGRSFRHPEQGLVPLNRVLSVYAWHGRHHVAHISSLRERTGWR